LSDDPDKRKKLWNVDPTMYDRSRSAGFVERRVIPPLRQFGKFALIALGLTYPIYLVYVGLAFGGIAFWSFLVGSFAVIGLLLTRLGFAANFRDWDVSMRRMATVTLAFFATMGFYVSLIYLRTWIVPVALLLVGAGAYFVIREVRS